MRLFTCLLSDAGIAPSLWPLVHRVAQILLRRVHSTEENLELQGISRVAEVPMYLLVSFNVILDLLMGCTSGAARTIETGQPPSQSKMLHFRTLDWDMDPLREVVVQLEFVKSAASTPDKVLATSLTYVGFVGVLTGVRRGLSMSFNSRPQHNLNRSWDNVRFHAHNLLVLLGRRRSISSLLRHCLFSDDQNNPGRAVRLDHLAETIPSEASTAAYLIFSDGQSAMTVEKDRFSGKVTRSRSFSVTTNHDLVSTTGTGHAKSFSSQTLLKTIIAESVDRRACMLEKWTNKVRKEQAQGCETTEESSATSAFNAAARPGPMTRSRLAASNARSEISPKDPTKLVDIPTDEKDPEEIVSLTKSELQKWLTQWPTTNECTHFSAILDPTEGRVVWAQRYSEPLEPPSGGQARADFVAAINDDLRN